MLTCLFGRIRIGLVVSKFDRSMIRLPRLSYSHLCLRRYSNTSMVRLDLRLYSETVRMSDTVPSAVSTWMWTWLSSVALVTG
ncbi:hypothetical protein D3C72_2032930 [compost metagenome]